MTKSFGEEQHPMRDLQGYLDGEKVKRILAEAAQTNPAHYVFLLTMACTGRRVSEVLELRPCDISFEDKNIAWHIKKKKDKNAMQVHPANAWVLDELAALLRREIMMGSSQERVFKFTRQHGDKFFKRYCAAVGINRVGTKPPHLHHLRHSFAINYLKANPDNSGAIRQLQQALAHSDIRITSGYLQYSSEDRRKSQDNLTQMYKKAEEEPKEAQQ